jgi:hypothetical protein
MVFDNRGALVDTKGANNLCSFDSYCFTATMLHKKKGPSECGPVIAKAYDFVKPIIEAEHPRTLTCFFEVFIHLIQSGLDFYTRHLCCYIGQMAQLVGKGPWGQICRLLGELDQNCLSDAIENIWRCIADLFENRLGHLHRLAIAVRLDCIKRLYAVANPRSEEVEIRQLLQKFTAVCRTPPPRVKLNLAHNLKTQQRYDEAEEIAAEVLLQLQEDEIVECIESLKIISFSQFHQGNQEAEKTIQNAISVIEDQWGKHHPWVLEFKNVLEGWLRSWGREAAANTLWQEINQLKAAFLISQV